MTKKDYLIVITVLVLAEALGIYFGIRNFLWTPVADLEESGQPVYHTPIQIWVGFFTYTFLYPIVFLIALCLIVPRYGDYFKGFLVKEEPSEPEKRKEKNGG